VGGSPTCWSNYELPLRISAVVKFVRRYAALREVVSAAVAAYTNDVRDGSFPGKAELYALKTG